MTRIEGSPAKPAPPKLSHLYSLPGRPGETPPKRAIARANNTNGRYSDEDMASAAACRLYSDRAAVYLNGPSCDGETQPCASSISRTAFVYPKKAVEDLVLHVLRNTRSRIDHIELYNI